MSRVRLGNTYNLDLGLMGMHVMITGASGGIGFETADLYYGMGSIITAHYNTNPRSLSSFLRNNSRAQGIQADLSDPSAIPRLFDRAELTFGPVQILIVNHGVSARQSVPLKDISVERWEKTLSTNLTGSFLVVREYLRRLEKASENLRDDACIIFVGSTAGKFGEAGNADYAASKSAIMYGLTMTLKNEIVKIAPKGRVNCIAPGWVQTPMAEEAMKNPDIVYSAMATTPLKKIAQPIDIAHQIVFLSSNKVSGHVSGQVIMVEGGMEGRLLNKREDVTLPGDEEDEREDPALD